MTFALPGPLSGVKVLDLTRVLAGPFGTMLLGDAGADVIKIESLRGDDTRQWGPPFAGDESAYYLSVNRNKRSIALDLSRSEGREVLQRLVRQADVLIENFKSGTLERWGLGYEDQLSVINPRLVYASITGYGHSGPYKDLPGYDVVAEAVGGLMSITGEPEGEPMKMGVAIVDVLTGCLSAYAVSAALREREVTDRGQRINLSLLEATVAALVNQASSFLTSGQLPARHGNAHPSIVPYQVFSAKDGPLMLAVGNDGQFRKLCAAIGKPDWAEDERCATNPQRVKHRQWLVGELQAVFLQRTGAEWLNLLGPLGVPVGKINTLDEVFSDPQVLHTGMLQQVNHPTAGLLSLVGLPVKFQASGADIRIPPPLLGQHTRAILAEAGFTETEVEQMLAKDVIAEQG